MFNADKYKASLQDYQGELTVMRDKAAASKEYAEAAWLTNLRYGVGAAESRMRHFFEPDPKPPQSNGDKALDEFTDWLAAQVALAGWAVLAEAFDPDAARKAAGELDVFKKIRTELQRLSKKYPSE